MGAGSLPSWNALGLVSVILSIGNHSCSNILSYHFPSDVSYKKSPSKANRLFFMEYTGVVAHRILFYGYSYATTGFGYGI